MCDLMNMKIMALLIIILLNLTSCATNKAKMEALEKSNRSASINIQLGMKYLERKDLQRSKTKFLLALQQAPQLPEAWYAMGYYLEATGDSKGAGKYYLKAVELKPYRGDVQNNYGTYLCRSHQYKEAIKHFELATKDPDYLDLASAYENAGLCSLKIPDKVLAARYFRQAIAQDPERKTSLKELVKLTQQGN